MTIHGLPLWSFDSLENGLARGVPIRVDQREPSSLVFLFDVSIKLSNTPCEDGGAQSETRGCVAMLTLGGSILTVERISVVNEGTRDKDRLPARDGLALSNWMRLAVSPAGSTE